MTHSWFHWLCHSSARGTRRRFQPRRPTVPQFLVLEDRTLLSVLTVLNNADSGAGSLRDTIAAAQSGDTIVFDPSLASETITLRSGPLALSSNLTIDGSGADPLAISGNQASQLFTLSGTARVTLANLTLTGGLANQGGAIFLGDQASLTLDSDILSGNEAGGATQLKALGGAIFNSAGASLTIDNTSFVNNQTQATRQSFGGAIANAGTLEIHGATFTGNGALGSVTQSSYGGAIGNFPGATATVTLSTFTGNQAVGTSAGLGEGGALCNGGLSVSPSNGPSITLSLSQCTFANNTATGGNKASDDGGLGGAIEDTSDVQATVLSCTFTGNQANSGGAANALGGAIDNGGVDFYLGHATDVTVTMSDSQFIDNSAIGSGVGATAWGGAVDNWQTMTIANCLFTGNSAVAGPMPDGVHTIGQALGGAIVTNGSGTILALSNSIVAGNEAIGGSGGNTLPFVGTDGAFGGGISSGLGTLTIAGCTITGNQAIGGATARGFGGAALGGGIETQQGTLNLTNSTVSTNICQAGAGASGAAGGIASGGGIVDDGFSGVNSIAVITNCTVSFNECLGGPGGAGANGGEAVGGGISNADLTLFGYPDMSSLTVSNCAIFGNVVQGGTEGSSAVGGNGLGGGLFTGSGMVGLQAVLVSSNQAQGGVDSQQNPSGNGLGGGVYIDPTASATANMQTLITGNQASKSNNDVWGSLTIVP